MVSRLLHDCIQIKAVGPPSSFGKGGQPLRGAVEKSISSNLISAGSVRHRNTDLRQPLPQIAFLDRPRLPTRLEHLVG